MLVAALLCWLGVGLWMLSTEDVAFFGAAPARWVRRTLGVFAVPPILLSLVPLSRELGIALGAVGTVLVIMSVLSAAVVMAPLRPRLFAASIPLAVLGIGWLALLGP